MTGLFFQSLSLHRYFRQYKAPLFLHNQKQGRFVVPLTGVEPVRNFFREILSLLCLPIPP